MAADRSHTAGLTMRFLCDPSWQRFDRVLVAGSPLKFFRVTPAGGAVLDALESGAEVGASELIERLLDAGAIHPIADPARPPTLGISDVTIVTPQLGGRAASDGRIVVDDGSTPPVVGATMRLDLNVGPGGARNAARPLVTTALIAFVDADVDVLDGRWIQRLLPHFDDDRVALVAPRVAGEPGSPIDLGDQPARIRAGTRVSYVPGAAIIVRTEAFDDIGGFDPRLRFGEDVDLVWRLDQRGWRCRYEPDAHVWHRPRTNVRERLRQNAGYGTSAAPLALRHPNSLSPLLTNGWTAAVWIFAMLGHPIVAAGTAVASAAALAPKLPDVPSPWSVRLALRGHLSAGRQFASAIRRVWWPLAAIAALLSRRARVVVLLSLLADPRAVPNDLGYGWGVWTGMRTHRTWRPIVPRLVAWPRRHERRAS